ncbi:hypothetical protein LSUE1_G001810 [Lachnellula suecica]|uniref:BTB domain-containing protein n=1 Tax=Lachnellula suecica TaxID=602035 RepID=A0A8T9CAL0_9HELO|nr:hypothetical protein LSUE1_G001810 [Lachnellula suecica]
MARTRGAGADRGETSLDAAMRAPSTQQPDVVVLDFVEEDVKVKDTSDPKKDLWLTTSDGRHQSKIIPVRVGPHAEEFPVHREILRKSEYFRKALDGEFREAENQAIDLPEEDPSIFSFVVAYLYEEKFVPIKPIATVLVAEPDKGKGKEVNEDANSESGDGTDSGSGSDESTRSRRRRDQRRRRQERAWEQRQRKEPGQHRPDCHCASCTTESIGMPCWNCGVTRRPPPPRNRFFTNNGMPPPPQPRGGYPPRPRDRDRDRRRAARNNVVVIEEPPPEVRMSPEDLRTWSYAYSLSIDVYVCANRYLMQDFKSAISAFIINNFEIAGVDAAQPSVLQSCKTLYEGVSNMDPLLKKIFARVGFLSARLWENFPQQISTFNEENPKILSIIMREMIARREEDVKDDLPAMDRPIPLAPPAPEEIHIIEGPRRYNGPRW